MNRDHAIAARSGTYPSLLLMHARNSAHATLLRLNSARFLCLNSTTQHTLLFMSEVPARLPTCSQSQAPTDGDIETVSKAISAAMDRAAQAEAESSSARTEAVRLGWEKSALEQRVAGMVERREMAETAARLAAAEDRAAAAIAAVAAAEAAAASAIAEAQQLQQKSEEYLAAAEERCKAERADAAAARAELVRLGWERAALEERICGMVERKELAAAAARTQAAEARVIALEGRIAASEAEAAAACSEAARLRVSLGGSVPADHLDATRAEAVSLRRDVDAARREVAAADAELRACRRERDRLAGRLAAAETLAARARGAAEEVAVGAASAAAALESERTALERMAADSAPRERLVSEQERACSLDSALQAARSRMEALEQVCDVSSDQKKIFYDSQ
jgi:hypothetical protein